MLKYTVFLIILLVFKQVEAQDYLINFAGKGDTNAVDKVKVDNLTKKLSVTINGTDVLHLKSALDIENQEFSIRQLLVFPNPSIETCFFTFNTPGIGEVVISITDFSGRIVKKNSLNLSSGLHRFQIKGLGTGMYVLSVRGEKFIYSTKFLSLQCFHGNPAIEYLSTEHNADGSPLKSYSSIIDMAYADGDQLIFTGISGQFSTVVPYIPNNNSTIEFSFASCKDIDNKTYAVVHIGTQTWMAENLAYLPKVSPAINGSLTQPFYYVYGYNDSIVEDAKQSDNYNTFGVLYNWAAAKGACPVGWHLPDDEDWINLEMTLGMSQSETTMVNWRNSGSVGRKLRDTDTTYWGYNSATNESGFTALPGGVRSYDFFDGINSNAIFWTSTENNDQTYAIARYLSESWPGVSRSMEYKQRGYSVRCVND
jgi:uncharacterized protein (TIGR02145 family)